jgi:mannitol 2-dehydrogenase
VINFSFTYVIMPQLFRLNSKNLPVIPGEATLPGYDRSVLKTGIVHIGVGAFHRAHQAYYTDMLLQDPGNQGWGICGVGLLESDRKIIDQLVQQDGLYSVMITGPDGILTARVIGSIIECLYAPDDPQAVIEKMADPDIKIITLTITEGGYNFDSATGEFLIQDAAVQADLKNPENPKTVFGYLTRALRRRMDRGLNGLTIQSCDNIPHNGDVLNRVLLAYVKAADQGMADWIKKNIAFPNSMVDRITPVITLKDKENLKAVFSIDDACPVVCEPYMQWVIEDTYASGRPSWETAGAKFVKDVAPYEKMKIRLLNAGHSLLGFLGTLSDCHTVDEAVSVPLIADFLRSFMDKDVTPVLGTVEGIDLEKYKDNLIQRFGNPFIKDNLSRICMESSAKIPKFVLPTIRENLESGGEIKHAAAIVAAWCRYLELAGTPGHTYEVLDGMKDLLQMNALASARQDPLAFIKTETLFGDLVKSERFVSAYQGIMDAFRRYGVDIVMRYIDQIVP